jgi:hypothetical protein
MIVELIRSVKAAAIVGHTTFDRPAAARCAGCPATAAAGTAALSGPPPDLVHARYR